MLKKLFLASLFAMSFVSGLQATEEKEKDVVVEEECPNDKCVKEKDI